jgi:hypothetical protein
MDRHRYDAKVRADEHHHGLRRARESRQELGMARMAESGIVEGLLVNGVGDHGRGFARSDEGHRALDRGQHGAPVGRVGAARRHVPLETFGQHGQAAAERGRCLGGRGDRRDRNLQGEPAGQGLEPGGIVDQEE